MTNSKKEIEAVNAYLLMEAPYMADLLKEHRYNDFMKHLKQSEIELVDIIDKLVDRVNELSVKLGKDGLQMTNKQWLIKEIQSISDEELVQQILCKFDICKSQLLGLDEYSCTVQSGKCKECYIAWLNQEHQEIPKLSDAERVILENISEHYKYITRDANGNLFIYQIPPVKIDKRWFCNLTSVHISSFVMFNNLFQFIKWNDTEPYCIQDLLKGE